MEQLAQKTVSYFYDEEYANHSLGGCNPMRPHRVRLTNRLLEGYNMTSKMQVHRPRALDYEGLNYFHADAWLQCVTVPHDISPLDNKRVNAEYLSFLSKVTPNNQREYKDQVSRFNLGAAGEADCPVFDGMFEYCQLYAGGSRDGALYLMEGKAEIAFNWAGGMHHAKRAEASGFCYVNDIVLSILELLKHYHRVLYVDIDIHHGDGVEEAFYLTDRVMTVSFHKYGDNFFPGTGACGDVGYAKGAGYSVNVPLKDGMDDESYKFIFEPVMKKVLDVFQPEAIAVCAGADSLSGDRLGCFNLSLEGHSNCLEFLALHNVPILILGGGGYTMRNVSRCWTYETARLQGVDLPDEIPEDTMKMHAFYKDTGRLRIDVSNMYNTNSAQDLETLRTEILQNLDSLRKPSGVAIAPQPAPGRLPDAPEEDPDVRGGGQLLDELNIKKDGYEAGEEATAGRVAERPPPINDPAPEINGNKIDGDVKKEEPNLKAEPMDAADGPAGVSQDAIQGQAATPAGAVEAPPIATASVAPAPVAPVQLGGVHMVAAAGLEPVAAAQLPASQGVAAPPAGVHQVLPNAAGVTAALSAMPGVIPGGVPVVAPGSVAPPAVMVQAQPGAPVTQAPATGGPAFPVGDGTVQQGAAPQTHPGQTPGGGAFQ